MPDFVRGRVDRVREHYAPRYYRWLQKRLLARHVREPDVRDIRRICMKALEVGESVSMDGIIYEPAHWRESGVLDQAPRYYHFLAGLVKTLGLRTVVEVGTWYGGSAQALSRGFSGPGGLVLTIDIELHNADGLSHVREIQRITGDAASASVLNQVQQSLAGRPVDLLYLDGDHRYESNRDIMALYGSTLCPKWFVLDDIHWQWSMEKLWTIILRRYGRHAFDAGTELGFRTGIYG